MGAPKVSSAIFTISIARTTPAQKPRGLSNKTRFSAVGRVSMVVAVTSTSIPVPDTTGIGQSDPYGLRARFLERIRISARFAGLHGFPGLPDRASAWLLSG